MLQLSSASGEKSDCSLWRALLQGRQSSEWAASALGAGQWFDGHPTGVSSGLTVVTGL